VVRSGLAPRRGSGRGRILIIVQNLPVPFDRRVWLECQSLNAAGYQVAVVCPKGPGDPGFAVIDGVEIYKYKPYSATGGKVSFVAEYAYSFATTFALTIKAARRGRLDVIQTCNPPDIFWPIGRLFRLIQGTRFTFDHHDLCPEVYESRFLRRSPMIYKALRLLERATVDSADHIISTNESYRSMVIDRDGADPAQVTVVRTGPDSSRLNAVAADPELRRGRKHLVAYIGVMGPQDGVDNVLRAADIVVNQMDRDDIAFTLIGSGDCFDELVALRSELGLTDVVHFTGRVPDETVAAILSTADVGISPDPKNSLNDVSTMNKTMEYMAFGVPVVAFDLRETRVSAGDAAVYARPNEVDELARLVVELVDDEVKRVAMGAAGRTRVENELAWSHQAPRYVRVYDELLAASPRDAAPRT
jgi:glycosyltransferase involved in cell wall biosynthesis